MSNLTATFRKNLTPIITIAVLGVLFVVAAQGMSTRDWIVTSLRGLAVGSVIFLVAAGFSIILGLMDVFNMAQGTIYMIGAYIGWSVYVRPDTFVDLLTPLALLIAGFLLKPLWDQLLSRIRLPHRVKQIWPWVGLVLAAVILLLTLPRAPVSIWSADDYQDSPIWWTQSYTTGALASIIEPARFAGASPILVLGGIFLGGALVALSLSGLALRGKAIAVGARRVPWPAIIAVVAVLAVGVGTYAFNDGLTAALLNLDSNWLFLIAVAVATLSGAALGGLMEITFIRPLYARPLYQILMTLGLSLLGLEMVRWIWGRTGFTMPRPAIFDGSGDGCPATTLAEWLQNNCSTLAIEIQGEVARIRVYNEIFIILVGVLMLVVIWLLIQRTRLGMVIRAGVQDSEMVEALGINVRQVFTLVFALGVGTAALGGVLSGPFTGLSDQMGGNLLLVILVTLAVGGLTSYPGAFVGAMIVGLVQQFIIKYGSIGINLPFLAEPFKPTPPLVPASTVLLMVIVLLVMPQGLLGRKE
jgi:branched-chain amino acid transport system permease protein